MRTLLSSVAALVFAGAAHAQLPPLTIEMVRMTAAIGEAPLASDVSRLIKCPDMHPQGPSDLVSDASAMDEARRLKITIGALWLRRNDAAIERCLKTGAGQ